jgi:hypothetical protein
MKWPSILCPASLLLSRSGDDFGGFINSGDDICRSNKREVINTRIIIPIKLRIKFGINSLRLFLLRIAGKTENKIATKNPI